MARRDEIIALLLQAGQALPRALTQQELLISEDVLPPEGAQ